MSGAKERSSERRGAKSLDWCDSAGLRRGRGRGTSLVGEYIIKLKGIKDRILRPACVTVPLDCITWR